MAENPSMRRRVSGREPKVIARRFCRSGELPASPDNLLSPAEEGQLSRIATILDYRANTTIFTEAEDAHFLYLIQEGVVRISRHLPDGTRQVLAFMWPGDLFGLAEEGYYVNSAEALAQSVVFRFPLDRLQETLTKEPLLQMHLLMKAAHELRQTQRQIIVLGRFRNSRRLASFLTDCLQHSACFYQSSHLLRLPMNRHDIADYLGMTAESAAHAFTRLEQNDYIRRASPRSIEIRDRERLVRFARGLPSRTQVTTLS